MDLFFLSLTRPEFLLAVPPIWGLLIWLDRRRRKPRRLLVACEALLPRLAPRRQQKAQSNWTLDLILMLLIALFATWILAGPQYNSPRSPQTKKIVVLERGLTTLAVERLDTLKARLLEESQSWPPETEVELHLNPKGRGLPWRGPVGELEAQLSSVASVPYERPTKDLLESLVNAGDDLVLVTDQSPPLDSWLAKRTRVIVKGRGFGNVALLRAGAKTLDEVKALAQVTLFNGTKKPRSLTLRFEYLLKEGGEVLSSMQKTSLEAGQVGLLFSEVPRSYIELRWILTEVSHGPEEARRDWDALTVDNEQILRRSSSGRRPVILSGSPPYELLRALSAVDGLDIQEGQPRDGVFSVITGQMPDPVTLPSLVLLPPKDGERFLVSPGSLQWTPDEGFPLHPFEAPTVARARGDPPSGLGELRPLLSTKDGAILLGLRGQGRSLLAYCGFSLGGEETDWSRQASFPLFFHSLLQSGQGEAEIGSNLPTGAWLSDLKDKLGEGPLRWGRVGESLQTLSPAGALCFEWPGVYVVESEDGRSRRWAVSVKGTAKTLWEDADELSEGVGKKARASEEREESGEKAPAFFAFFCILILIARRMNVFKSGPERA